MNNHPPDPRRRQFIRMLTLGGAMLGLGLRPTGGSARTTTEPAVLAGSEFDLRIGWQSVNITGRERRGIAVNGSIPGPLLRWREGDTVTLRVTNELDELTSIHWHGILLPPGMDGVPGLSFPGIAPGETFVYQFPVRQTGTYWYHSHSGHQEQLGLYGGLCLDPPDRQPDDPMTEHVVILSDWSDEEPQRVLARLKKQPDYYNLNQRTMADLFRDLRRDGLAATLADRRMWGAMRMNPTDLADVTGHTYTYLLNGQAPGAGWTGLFEAGEPVRLRFINAAAMTLFDVRVPGLTMTVVAADGQPVEPVTVDEFRIGVGETYDVLVDPGGRDAWTVFAQSLDRTGFAAGTLATRPGLRAVIPALDDRVLLTMADMGHGTPGPAGHDAHAGHAGHDGHGAGAAASVSHAATEFGPAVDMRNDNPSSRLDDPGVGLRDNGRRVLTYADLRTTFPDPDGRQPGRTIELHLTGNMERYRWSFNGQTDEEAGPIRLQTGERVRFLLVNDTMMEHPIHLHGLWSDLEDEAGNFQVRKHTVSVKPGQRLSFRVTADTDGPWAFHCHLSLHMDSGMLRTVIVGDEGPDLSAA